MSKVKLVKFAPLTLKSYVEEDDGEATLQWSIRMGYPRITVYRHIKDTDKGKEIDYSKIIIAPFDYVNFSLLISYIREVNKTNTPVVYKIACYNVEFVDNVKTDKRILQAVVKVGKDLDGCNYIELSAPEKLTIRFPLLPNFKWHVHDKLNDKGESVLAPKDLSTKFTTAYAMLINKLVLDEYPVDARTEVMLDPPNSKKLTNDKIDEI